MMMQRQKTAAVFLDRDGTINVDSGYPDSAEKIELLPGVIEAVRQLNDLGANVFIVTNQSGVARGIMTEETVRRINLNVRRRFAEKGAMIVKAYYCPHHPEGIVEAYRKRCLCRKPMPGLINLAADEHNVDLQRAVMVGDKLSDIGAGKKAGVKTVLVLTGEGEASKKKAAALSKENQPDQVADDLLAAVKIIEDNNWLQ